MDIKEFEEEFNALKKQHNNEPARRKAIDVLLRVIESDVSTQREIIDACKIILENV
jgi:hypothetical protein